MDRLVNKQAMVWGGGGEEELREKEGAPGGGREGFGGDRGGEKKMPLPPTPLNSLGATSTVSVLVIIWDAGDGRREAEGRRRTRVLQPGTGVSGARRRLVAFCRKHSLALCCGATALAAAGGGLLTERQLLMHIDCCDDTAAV